ncbi:MAG: transporter [Clostridiales bacterium]|jgi:ATP-binding cassette subfamily B protein|nr:transporter [Clostridiales bacterium]
MLRLGSYLKKYSIWILFAIALIYTQAQFDLALPDYMAKIVDVGISKSGIEHSIPTAIRASEFDKIKLFLDEDTNRIVEDSYILLDRESLSTEDYDKYVAKYPILANEPIYKLNTKVKEIEEIDLELGKAIMIVGQMSAGEMPGLSMAELPEGMTIFDAMAVMPAEQRKEMLSGIEEKLALIPEAAITSVSANYLAAEYETIGLNIKSIQNSYLFKTGGIMTIISLLSLLVTIIASLIFSRIAAGVSLRMRSNIFSKVEHFSGTEFDKFSTASLITRTTNDVQQVQLVIVMLRLIIYAPILGVGGIIRVSSTNSSMVWIIALAVVTMLILVASLFSVAIPKFKKIQKLVDKVNLVTRESLIGIMVIRAFNTQKHEEKRFDDVNQELTKTNLFVHRAMSLMMPMMTIVMNGTSILIVWFGAKQIDAGGLQIGSMVAFIQYAMQIIMSFLMLSMVFIMVPRASVSANRIFEILDTKPTIKDPEKANHFSNNNKGLIEFKNVSFSYPGAEESVLKDITFTAQPGKTTAFIGSTGSGKSTLINLIPRFYDISKGELLVDGENVKNVTQHELREKIGYVPQKGLLFSGTIASNLRYANENATDEDLEKAADIAQATEFIRTKPEGYETEIAEGGTNVSGGQKQRLSIARALVKKPEIYIFDDSFSALDFKTDAELRKALKAETGNSTKLIVAQRISTIIDADQIIVLDEGEIVGIGTHKELLNTCEVYKEIAYSQLSKEELA